MRRKYENETKSHQPRRDLHTQRMLAFKYTERNIPPSNTYINCMLCILNDSHYDRHVCAAYEQTIIKCN